MVRRALVIVLLASGAAACAEPRIIRTAPQQGGKADIAQLWVDRRVADLDLFWGPGGKALAPSNGATFRFKEEKRGGYSPGYAELEDGAGREWNAKQGPEAQTEVVASRIYWAVGYHQPPTYFVAEWRLEGGPDPGPQKSARFRPDIGDVIGDWSLHQNPFVGTQPYRGLLVLSVILNNWDIKTEQNKVYAFDAPRDGARLWYVARDLGATFGRPRWPDGSRNNADHFEKHPFLQGFDGDRPKFAYQGRHDELLAQIRRRDIRWISERLAQITDRQLADAFRAAAYPDDVAARFIGRLKAKIAEGLAACPRGC